MRASWLFLSVLVVLAMACPAARADTTYKLDNNYADNEIVGDTGGDQAFINVFNTDPSNPVINSVQVAWGGLPAGEKAEVVLYGVSDSYTGALPQYVAPTSYLTVLQSLGTVVTSGQRNDDSGAYPPGGPTSSTFTTYDIPATLITTQRFAVGVIAYENETTYGCVWNDTTANTGSADVLIAMGPGSPGESTLALNADLSNLNGSDQDIINLRVFNPNSLGVGAWDEPYLIRAQGVAVPEPSTLALLGVGMAFALVLVRRVRPAK